MAKYNDELVDEICGYVSDGLSDTDACALAGISRETFYNWKREFTEDDEGNKTPNPDYKPDFSDKLKKAELERKRTLTRDIITEKAWQAKAWYLERKYNKEFALRRIEEHEGFDGFKIEVVRNRKDVEESEGN